MSSSVNDQVHSKFKLFAGALSPDGSLGLLAKEVETFAAAAKAAPKSIGVEYLEHSNQVVVSLGYRDDEPPYPIKLSTVSLGKIESLSAEALTRLETTMAEAASKTPGVICHELLVTGEDEFIMVFMATAN